MKRRLTFMIIACMMFGFAGCDDLLEPTTSTTEKSVSSAQEKDIAVEERDESVEPTTIPYNKNSINILYMEGHPKLFDKVEEAKKFYSHYFDDGSIILRYADHAKNPTTKYGDVNLLAFNCYRQVSEGNINTENIEGLEFYFDKNSDNIIFSLPETINLLKEYIPLDIFRNNYIFIDSGCQDSYYSNIYKFYMQYQLNTDTSNYPQRINISIWIDRAGNLETIYLESEYREYHKSIEWNYDITNDDMECPLIEFDGVDYSKKSSDSAVVTEAPVNNNITVNDQAANNNSYQQNYIINNNTNKFHEPGCSSLRKSDGENLDEVYASRDDLINQGYSPCGVCKP